MVLTEISQTKVKDGGSVKFKLHDKKGALDSVARHLGMFNDKLALAGADGKGPVTFVMQLHDEGGE